LCDEDFRRRKYHSAPELHAAWQHEYGDRAYPVDSQFASCAGELSLCLARRLVGIAGLAVQWTERVFTYVYYDGQLDRGNHDSDNASEGLQIKF
jgi:hypothetical protein